MSNEQVIEQEAEKGFNTESATILKCRESGEYVVFDPENGINKPIVGFVSLLRVGDFDRVEDYDPRCYERESDPLARECVLRSAIDFLPQLKQHSIAKACAILRRRVDTC